MQKTENLQNSAVVITGSSQGIGKATTELFLKQGFEVFGIDMQLQKIYHPNYHHFVASIEDIVKKAEFRDIFELLDFSYIVHNAGIQNGENVIQVNLVDTINLDTFLRKNHIIKADTFNTSISGIYGDEFSNYVASKAGLNGYVKKVAKELMPNGIANAVCFGGVQTELNAPIMKDFKLFEQCLRVNPLHRWATAEEAAEWIFFVTVVNKFATGQLFEIDGGENSCPASTFVWPRGGEEK